jgi:hypothetical protein
MMYVSEPPLPIRALETEVMIGSQLTDRRPATIEALFAVVCAAVSVLFPMSLMP